MQLKNTYKTVGRTARLKEHCLFDLMERLVILLMKYTANASNLLVKAV